MKKLIAIVITAILSLSLATTALAAPVPAPRAGYGFGCGGYGLMCDENGNFLSRDAFESKLDKAIEDGLIRAEDKAVFLERYEYCAEYGGGYGMRAGRGLRRRWMA